MTIDHHARVRSKFRAKLFIKYFAELVEFSRSVSLYGVRHFDRIPWSDQVGLSNLRVVFEITKSRIRYFNFGHYSVIKRDNVVS